MALNLVKGQSDKLNNLNLFHIGLGWDVREDTSEYDFDLDVSAFMIGKRKKVIGDDYVVFYNSENLKSASYLNGNLNGRKELEHYAS